MGIVPPFNGPQLPGSDWQGSMCLWKSGESACASPHKSKRLSQSLDEVEFKTAIFGELLQERRKGQTIRQKKQLYLARKRMLHERDNFGSPVSQDLKWEVKINSTLEKIQQGMYVLQLLTKYGLSC